MVQATETEAEITAVQLSNCTGCGRKLRQGWGFAFRVPPHLGGRGTRTPGGVIIKCILCSLRHIPMLRRSITVALVVGTILTLLNHGDTILAGNWKSALYWKIPLTYCVPFCVATFGALTNSRR